MQFSEVGSQSWQRDSTSGPKSQLHLGFLQPTSLLEDESLGAKVGIFAGSTLGNAHWEQR